MTTWTKTHDESIYEIDQESSFKRMLAEIDFGSKVNFIDTNLVKIFDVKSSLHVCKCAQHQYCSPAGSVINSTCPDVMSTLKSFVQVS
jgi:hypothetical protein